MIAHLRTAFLAAICAILAACAYASSQPSAAPVPPTATSSVAPLRGPSSPTAQAPAPTSTPVYVPPIETAVPHVGIPAEYPPTRFGVANPNVSQANIKSTICVTGWTATVRPPVSYTEPLKLKDMQLYQLKGTPADYELDHFIALTDGGDPRSEGNLWMMPYNPDNVLAPTAAHQHPGAREKDKVEVDLNHAVCSGQLTLAQAQDIITTDWVAYYQQHIAGSALEAAPPPSVDEGV